MSHVLLLGLEWPNTQGLELISTVVARWPKLAILVLTIHDDSARIFAALKAGVMGNLIEPVSPAKLLEAIAEARAGGSPMSSQIARLVVKRLHEQGRSKEQLTTLTPREEEILHHVSTGRQTKEIAELLDISARTVSSHSRNIYEKLHAQTRSQAVAKFLPRKLQRPGESLAGE